MDLENIFEKNKGKENRIYTVGFSLHKVQNQGKLIHGVNNSQVNNSQDRS